MRRWRGAACTYQHEAGGETKRAARWVGADPKFTRSTDRVLLAQRQLLICDCRSAAGSGLEKGVLLVVVQREGIEVWKYVVLPVNADHLIEQSLEFSG